MWKYIRRFIFTILVYGVLLFLIHKYSNGWFWVEATRYNVFLTFTILAIFLWIINNIVKFVLKILTIPLKYLTLGLFSLVLNMLLIYIFEFVVNNYSMGVIIHLGNLVQVFMLSLTITLVYILVKKII